MAISLTKVQKGQKVSLEKVAPGKKEFLVGLGWDTRATDGQDFDLDASAFLLGENGKVKSEADFIFYGKETDAAGSVVYGGDNLTGQGDGDDETIMVDLSKVPGDVGKIALTVTIHEADLRGQNFGMVSNAFIRLVDKNTGEEVLRYDLSEDYSIETALVFAELYRHNGEWKFAAVGQGYEGGLAALAVSYGVDIE